MHFLAVAANAPIYLAFRFQLPTMIHRFVPGSSTSRTTILLLHGTGGNEDDLLPLGRSVAPGAALLSPRGEVLERGMPRFFRRLAEGVFDEPDLIRRTEDLANFVGWAAQNYKLEDGIIALGYSNGANIAASLMLLHPEVLRGAVLMHAMVPLTPSRPPVLNETSVLMTAGDNDPIVPAENTERLAEMLRAAGASVEVRWAHGGHSIAAEEIDAAREWMAVK